MMIEQTEFSEQEDRFVIDTWAFIEYLEGTEEGRVAKVYIEEKEAIVPDIVVLELADIIARGRINRTFSDLVAFINTKCKRVHLTDMICERAGIIKTEKRKTMKNFGINDSVILATAENLNCKIVSGDPHLIFQENVISINELVNK